MALFVKAAQKSPVVWFLSNRKNGTALFCLKNDIFLWMPQSQKWYRLCFFLSVFRHAHIKDWGNTIEQRQRDNLKLYGNYLAESSRLVSEILSAGGITGEGVWGGGGERWRDGRGSGGVGGGRGVGEKRLKQRDMNVLKVLSMGSLVTMPMSSVRSGICRPSQQLTAERQRCGVVALSAVCDGAA